MMKSIRNLAFAAFLALAPGSLAVATPAGAASFADGLAAYEEGRWEVAWNALAPLAHRNDSEAQYFIGIMLRDGDGVGQDFDAAVQWIGYAAVAGSARAQYDLALFYVDDGFGTPADPVSAADWFEAAAGQDHPAAGYRLALALRQGAGRPASLSGAAAWMRRAAAQGLANAQFELGNMYWRGEGVAQDYLAARGWSQRAAEQGHTKAQVNLGYMYSGGYGIEADPVLAHMWFNIAAATGDGEAVDNRAGIAARMTPEEIEQAQTLAGNWRVRPRPAPEPVDMNRRPAPGTPGHDTETLVTSTPYDDN